MTDIIATYSRLFAAIGIDNAEGAAAYYTLLIREYPTAFAAIKDRYRRMMIANAQRVHMFDIAQGRKELFDKGYLAKVLIHDSNIRNENVIPIDPGSIWDANKEAMMKIYPDYDFNQAQEDVKMLKEHFNKFGPLGVWIQEGDITISYQKPWFYGFIIHNLKPNSDMCLMLSALGSFRSTHLTHYRSMLDQNLKLRLLYDKEAFYKRSNEMDNVNILLNDYRKNFHVRFTPITHVTSRRVISDNFAIDARKRLLEKSESNHASTYIGTIYLQEEIIEFLKTNFNSAWDKSERGTEEK